MRAITQALLALGFVGAIAVCTPATTKAQGVSIYGPGYEVDIGARRYPYPYRRYYRDYDNSYGYYRPYSRPGYYNTWNGCRQGFTVQDGVCKPYRGY